MALAMLLAGCGSGGSGGGVPETPPDAATPTPIESGPRPTPPQAATVSRVILLSAPIVTAPMVVGASETVQAIVTFTDAQSHPVPPLRWSTTDPSVVVVSAEGVVTAVGEGWAQVSASAPTGRQGVLAVRVERLGTRLAGGEIADDTAWTEAGSPYRLVGDVRIGRGVALTIEPGVIVTGPDNLAPGTIEVAGTLRAAGAQGRPVVFRNVRVVPAGAASSPHSIELAYVELNGGTLYGPTAYPVFGSLRVVGSRLQPEGSAAILYPTSPVLIDRTDIRSAWPISIAFVQPGAEPFVVIRNSHFWWPSIETLDATGSATGTVLELNTFEGRGVALSLPAGRPTARMTATRNWWGTTDAAAIAARIFDANVDPASAGTIPFEPFLFATDPDTPVL